MTQLQDAIAPRLLADDPAFDFGRWRLEPRQMSAAALVLAFAVATALRGEPGDAAVATLIVGETGLLCLPWRVPRSRRSSAGFWAEVLVGLLSPLGAVVAAFTWDAPWLRHTGHWWWYPIGAATGWLLITISGLRLTDVVSGALSFAKGPTRRSHKFARTFGAFVGPPGEESLFRAPAAMPHATASYLLLAAVAFVARHHVQAGTNNRGTARAAATEIAASVLLLVVTIASGSIFPALTAHLVNNLPLCVVELRRDNAER